MKKQVNMDAMDKDASLDEDEQMEEILEDQFLKGLYLFMRKRDTPIERIPHLGFKQIDLFLMYKIVSELGGYSKVTSQQLWKQVYNQLGGNPRSTSAATCTRRHYEKLLLPYECHLKGTALSTVSPLQHKHFHYSNYTNSNHEVLRAATCRPPLQSPGDHPSDHHGGVFSPSLRFPHYYPSNHKALPHYVPISSSPPVLRSTQLHSPQIPAPEFNFSSRQPHPSQAERTKEPLEHLRHLAEQYKSSSGLMEPLNLSVKEASQKIERPPAASSFSPPSSSKTPKFLNKPSPLYAARHPGEVRGNGCETEDAADTDAEVSPYPYLVKSSEPYIIDVKSTATSPTLRADEATAHKPGSSGSPKTDFTIWSRQEEDVSPEGKWHGAGHLPPGVPQGNGGTMEIQIPLSVLHNWLKVYGSSATAGEQLQAPSTKEEGQSGQGSSYEPTGLTFHTNSRRHWSPGDLDLKLRNRSAPQTSSVHHDTSQNHFSLSSGGGSGSKASSSGVSLKRSHSPDPSPDDQINNYRGYWESFDKEPHIKTSPSPVMIQQESLGAGTERSEAGHSSMLMMNSGPGTVLHLTTEEVMKLKRMISSSL